MKTLRTTLLLLFIGLVSFSFAQDLNEAGTAFNDGNEAIKAKKFADAVQYYENSLDMCQMIGGDAAELQGKVEAQLTKVYYYNAQVLYKKKNFDSSVEEFKKAIDAAAVSSDEKTKKKASAFIPKVYSSQGLSLVKEKNYDDAITTLNKAFEYDEKCVNANYGLGLAYKGKGDIDQAVANFDAAIANGADNPKAAKTVKKVKSAGSKMLEATAAKELQIENSKEAVDYLNKAVSYSGGSFNSYYLLALANNKLKNFDAAIEAATTSLTFDGGDANSANLELGKAYEGKGDNANACAAYKKVTAGPNVKAAEFQIKEVLKCN
jgi:tetratricopeptide (TPR) repeat protein